MRTAFRTLMIGLLALITTGCSPNRIASSWIAPGTTPSQYRHLVVLGVAANEKVRQAYEDNFVTALQAVGVRAQAGHTLLPEEDPGKTNLLQEAVSRSGADGILVTHLVGDDSGRPDSPVGTHVIPSLYHRLYPYYSHVHATVTSPDYYSKYQALRLETNLYDAARKTLIWSGRSALLDPSSEQTMISEVIKAVVSQLRRDGFI